MPVERVAETLSSLVREFHQHHTTATLFPAIIQAAVTLVPGAEEGSVSAVTGRRGITCEAPTSDLPQQIDALQERCQQGPCLDAAYQHHVVIAPDLSTEVRWPRFSADAAGLGAASMLSLQLYVGGDNLGALNLIARAPHSFTDDSARIGLLVATHSAIAYANTLKRTQLDAALRSRDLIGQAIGILAERYRIGADTAFLLLTRLSQANNKKVHDIAGELIRTGTAPGIRGLHNDHTSSSTPTPPDPP